MLVGTLNNFTYLSRCVVQKRRTNDKNEEKQKSGKKDGWWAPLNSFHFSQSVYFNKYELNTIRLWIHKRLSLRCLGLWYEEQQGKKRCSEFYEVDFCLCSPFFWQTLCHSNRLRKIWTKNALFPLASFFFFFHVSRPLFSEAAGVVQGAPLPFVHHRKLRNYAWKSYYFFWPFSTADCSELQFCAAFMCVLILMCHRGESTNLQPLSWRCKIFESVLFDHTQSVLSLSLSTALARCSSFRLLKFEVIQEHMVFRQHALLRRQHVRQMREASCGACLCIRFSLNSDYRKRNIFRRMHIYLYQIEWLMIRFRFPKFGRGKLNGIFYSMFR